MKKIIKPMLLCAAATLIAGCGELNVKYKEPKNEVTVEEFEEDVMNAVMDYKLFSVVFDDDPVAFPYVMQLSMTTKVTTDGETTETTSVGEAELDTKHNVLHEKLTSDDSEENAEIYYSWSESTRTFIDTLAKEYSTQEHEGAVSEKDFQLQADAMAAEECMSLLELPIAVAPGIEGAKAYIDGDMYTIVADSVQTSVKAQVVLGEKAFTAYLEFKTNMLGSVMEMSAMTKVEFKNKTVKAPKTTDFKEVDFPLL